MTSRHFFLICLLTAFSISPCASYGQQQPASDTQFWSELQFSQRIRPSLAITALGSLRSDQAASHLFEEHLGAGVKIFAGRYLSFAPAFRHIRTETYSGAVHGENRWTTDAFLRIPLPRQFAVVDRNRGELRMISGQLSERYRNQVLLEKALLIERRKTTPYLAAETFYDTHYHSWNRRRAYFGIRVPLVTHLILDTYYMRQHDPRSIPPELNVIYTALRIER